MLRSFAGIYDSAGIDASDRARLIAALDDREPIHSIAIGALAVAWTGSVPPHDAGGPWCLLDGQIYGAEGIPDEEGLAAREPERWLTAAYRRWGEGVLARLRGDFVALIYDPERDRGLLAVDHIGIRSLVLHERGSRLVFGSEVRELVGALPRRPAPEHATVAYWLMATRMPPDRTLYEGINRMPSGHVLRLADGRWTKRRYWEPSYEPRLAADRDEAVDGIRRAIVRAVDRRLRPGESAGITLSGGLDSSTVAGVATRCVDPAKKLTHAYSGTFPDHPAADERELIETGARAYGLRSTRIEVRGGSALSGGLEYLRRWDVPSVSANVYWWSALGQRATQDGVHVLLDGEDGDRLFGIAFHYLADLVMRGRVSAAGRLVHRMGVIEQRTTHALVLELLYHYGLKYAVPPELILAVRARRSSARHVPPWFTTESGRAYHATETPTSFMRRGVPRWWGSQVESLTRGAGQAILFDHTRRRAGLAGLEMRHPFADVDLMELVLRLPHELAYDPRFSRPLVREAMVGIVPEELRLRRSKSFFDGVQREALVSDLAVIDRLLSAPDARIGDYVRLDVVRRELLDRAPGRSSQPDRSWNIFVWRLIMLECWLRNQEDGSFVDGLLEGGELAAPRLSFAVSDGGRSRGGSPSPDGLPQVDGSGA